jgi:RHS repeat-associated protein
VLVRTQRTCRAAFASNPALACTGGLLRRTIWSGDDVLGEIQMPVGPTFAASWMEVDTAKLDLPAFTTPSWNDPNPRYGRVAYTHAGGMDRPLAITRMGYVDHPSNAVPVELPAFTIVPHWDPRGQADVGTMANGGTQSCHPTLTTRCAGVYWKTRPFAFVQNGGDPTIVPWHGTLKDDGMDGTGTLYRRNRTVSPETGRFTQEDPIGLAGGLNLYGFAGGDPVNFSDPFGLCPERQVEVVGFCYDPAAVLGFSIKGVFGSILGASRFGSVTQADNVVSVSRSRHPESAAHIEEAQAGGQPSTLTIDRAGARARRKDALSETPTKRGADRDEYPPAMFKEGGKGASVRHINPADNRGAGACIGAQCRTLPDATTVRIEVVPEE